MKLIHKDCLISIPYSLQKYAKSFQQWDKVHAFNLDTALNYEAFLSTCNSSMLMGEHFIINDRLKANKNLEIWTFNEWKTIGNLKIGDFIFTDHNKYERVENIEPIFESCEAVEVQSTANYFLERYLVK